MTVLDLPKRDAKSRRPARPAIPPPRQKPRPYRFSLEDYLWLSEHGLFDGRRVEFIDGEIIEMPSQLDDHAFGVTRSGRALDKVFPDDRFWVRTQMTLLVGRSAPEPDVAVIPGAAKGGRTIPEAADALLVVEVSDATLLYDRRVKSSLYAAGGILDYILVNVVDRQLEVHRDPVPDQSKRHGHRYASITILKPGQTFTALAAPQAAIAVDDFM